MLSLIGAPVCAGRQRLSVSTYRQWEGIGARGVYAGPPGVGQAHDPALLWPHAGIRVVRLPPTDKESNSTRLSPPARSVAGLDKWALSTGILSLALQTAPYGIECSVVRCPSHPAQCKEDRLSPVVHGSMIRLS